MNAALTVGFILSILALFPFAVRADENQKRFEALLLKRDLIGAAHFVPYFMSVPSGIGVNRLLAQFDLMTCRPQSVQARILKMPEGTERDLFQAVLWALVSVPRPAEPASRPVPTTKASRQIRQPLTPAHQPEIWADEWPNIEVFDKPCERMPLVKEGREQRFFQEKAKNLFERLPAEKFKSDFNIVALALDVGAEIPQTRDILKHYKKFFDNPYYKRLLAQHEEAQDAGAIVVSGIQKNEIELSPLRLREVSVSPHLIETPLLIGRENGAME